MQILKCINCSAEENNRWIYNNLESPKANESQAAQKVESKERQKESLKAELNELEAEVDAAMKEFDRADEERKKSSDYLDRVQKGKIEDSEELAAADVGQKYAEFERAETRFNALSERYNELTDEFLETQKSLEQEKANYALAVAERKSAESRERVGNQSVRELEQYRLTLATMDAIEGMDDQELAEFKGDVDGLHGEMQDANFRHEAYVEEARQRLEAGTADVLARDESGKYKVEAGETTVNLNVRRGGPGTNNPIAETVPKGEQIKVIAPPMIPKPNGDVWAQVADEKGQPTGDFVAVKYEGKTYVDLGNAQV